MKRANFEVRDHGRTVVLTQPNGVIREFHIPYRSSGDSYVREGDNMGPQVGERLSHSGNMLTATTDSLARVIRREWAAYRRTEWYQAEMDMETVPASDVWCDE